ncbi:hypothetical protein [Kitasatospora herbaricolor]|uniref:Uncharacterized protein n=1 Tax=Kitasatospora herbaricolor TaxID=68217 RepID=A0ABZ1WFS8_9ACTN|nr:hypothetical protein [Kitasatospora herbaricolor]
MSRRGPAALWAAVLRAHEEGRPRTLKEVIGPVRAYLLWALDADRPFEGATVFAGEIAQAGRTTVRVRVELVAVEPGGRVAGGPPVRPPGPGEPGPPSCSNSRATD